ncbi:MAG: ribosome biogenesis GTPase YlqF [Halanaerobiales bacterium]|nr:ribosome biogenesis GTPase YlqF [Halanaerobiales bacterium]
MKKNIQWYPGHMAKAKRILQEHLKMVDIVLELLDARIPSSSSNPDLDKLVKDKDRIIIFNKSDLANPDITLDWVKHLSSKFPSFAVDAVKGKGLADVLEAVRLKGDEINARLKKRGRNPRNIRLAIIGIPNVGKSALINRIAKRSSAKVANKPGVTRGKQWIKVREGFHLLDSPGILWPKFDSQEVGIKLAATGAIRSDIFNEEEVAFHLTGWLMENAQKELELFFGVELVEDPYEMMLAIGRKRGFIQSGGRIRTEQTARMILKEFRDGRIGRITIERPMKGGEKRDGNGVIPDDDQPSPESD